MYRDLINDPEKIFYGNRVWWVQVFCRWDGTLKAVCLYDEDGELLGEFQSREEAIAFMEGSK